MAKEQLELFAELVEDQTSRENFDRIRSFFANDLFTRFDGNFFTYSFDGAVTNFRFPHQLRFVPKDIIVTSKIGAGTVTFNYALFSSTHLDITTTGAADIRFIAGVFLTNR